MIHAEARSWNETDWPRITQVYDELERTTRSPVVALNRAVAVAMAQGPAEGLRLVEGISGLDRYHLLHAARADLLRRLDRRDEAAAAYARALALAKNPVEREFLERRLAELR